MSEEKFYRVLQEFTNGWDLVAPRLTKEQADQFIDLQLRNGVNPNHLKVVDEPNPEEENDDPAYRPFVPKEETDQQTSETWPPASPS